MIEMVGKKKVIYNGEYSELVNAVKYYTFLDTMINVVVWILEHKGFVDMHDFDNIKKLCDDGFIR